MGKEFGENVVKDTMYTALEAGGCKEAKTILNAVLVFRTVFSLANMADSIGNAKRFTETYQDKDWDRWAKQLAGESKKYDENVKLSDGNILGEYQKGVIKNKSGSYSGADNIADGTRLKEYYRQAERYGTDSIKELENGRYKFYEELKLAKTQGEMAGARHVREWNLTVSSLFFNVRTIIFPMFISSLICRFSETSRKNLEKSP